MGGTQSTDAAPAPPPPLTTRIPLAELIANPEAHRAKIIDCMRENGLITFRLDEETQRCLKDYLAIGQQFFSLPAEEKSKLSATVQIDELVRKKNKGYIIVEGVKEFLKLKVKEKYDALHKRIYPMLDIVLNLIATHRMPDGQPYMDTDIYNKVTGFASQDSSISLIKYLGGGYASGKEEEYPEQDEIDKAIVLVPGKTVPSAVHTDTGLLTLIMCSEVPGLQVWDRHERKFVEVEKLFDPLQDMFLIIGRKTTLFARSERIFPATVHRVEMPEATVRNQLLLFMDVRQ